MLGLLPPILRRPSPGAVLLLSLVFLLSLVGCTNEEELGDEHGVFVAEFDEYGKPTLDSTGWEEPAGKADAMQGRPGLPISVDDADTAVWEIRNAWEDRNTPEAREAGMAWPAESGLSWEEKYHRWVESMEQIDRPGHGETFLVTTPYGVTLPAPSLECAEVAMFLRIAFASWYGLPFFTEATDGKGNRLYFGHFGIRTADGRYGRMANFKTQYQDYSHLAEAIQAGEAQWPTDSNLAGRRIPGSFDDSQPMIGEGVGAGAYFDQFFLNKRVGYYLMMQLTYFGSVNLADPVNTYHVTPEGLRPGDTLLHRWQRTGIGHVMVVMRADRFGEGSSLQIEAHLASGSMPRRQPLWEHPAAAKRNFVSSNAGGEGTVEFNGGVKRWRIAKEIGGRWTNVVPQFLASEYIPATARNILQERPERFEQLLAQLEPAEQLAAMASVVETQRAHLRNYPASCAARTRREQAFEDLYKVGEALGISRHEIDEEFRTLEDYVFAELVYGESKTCCWNSTTNKMYQLAMDLNRQIIENTPAEACPVLVVFKNRDDDADGFEVFRDFARSMGQEEFWVAWSADENCPQANVPADTEADHHWTDFCELNAEEPPVEDEEFTTIFASNDTVMDIPDNDPVGVQSALEIAHDGLVEAIRVDVNITHTWRGDLRLYLLKDGEEVEVYRGSGSEDDLVLLGHPVYGFEGIDASGTWELKVVDTMAQDTGALNTWTLYLDVH